jgi:rhodanese-related sulfurtransferase
MWSGIFLLTLTAILSIAYFFRLLPITAVHPKAARSLLRETPHIAVIDVRTDVEWAAGHYPGAHHVPEITRLPYVIQDRNTTLLLYCRTGRRAKVAAQATAGLGYTSIYYLVDGSYEDLNI